jgi:SAM-dependent methyltransferase
VKLGGKNMNLRVNQELDYGNWVSNRLLYISSAISVALGVLSLAFPLLLIPTIIVFLCFLYLFWAHYRFSPRGGDIQRKVQELVLMHLEWDGGGKALDIGCGNGPLAIAIAKKYLNAEVTGIDYWGGEWDYSKALCESNAEIEGVANRVTFQQASASSLPFDSESFDVVVSNLVFHEVKDIADKKDAIREALRVVRKGGKFVFQDLFVWKRLYGEGDQLLDTIRSWGVDSVELVSTCDSEFIPRALKLPFMLGTIGILHGRK